MDCHSPGSLDSLLLATARPPRIISISLADMTATLVVPDCGGVPQGIAIDVERSHVFWTNMGEDSSRNDGFIERADLDGANRTEIVQRGQTFTPKQVVVEAKQGLLYWADCEGMRVMRSRLDGTEVTVLVQTGETEEHRREEGRHCVGIAVDSANGFIYWTQKCPNAKANGRIFRAGLELPPGADPRNRPDLKVALAELPEPISLIWDSRDGFLYWTDRGPSPSCNTLNRAKYLDGRLIEPEIVLSGLDEGIALALDIARGRAFVTDLGGAVRMMKLERTGESEVILSGHGPLSGIVFVPRPSCT